MRSVIFATTVVVAACTTSPTATIPKGGPRGLRASEHLDLARQHDEVAANQARMPQPVPLEPGRLDQPVAIPWTRSWSAGADDARIAAQHRSKAAEIEAEYEAACGSRSWGEVEISPLVRYGIGGAPTSRGATVYLSPVAGGPDELMALMRCHRAFMMLAPTDMDDCPLDLPHLTVDARGDTDGITVDLSVDPKLVPELQRRVAHDLEVSGHTGPALSAHAHP